MNKHITRRTLIARSLQLPLGGAAILALSSCGEEGGSVEQVACADPDSMSASEASMRSSLGYTPKSPDPAEQCSRCSYFTADAGGCGACSLLGGASVSEAGRCDSWSARG
ncbi:MAG: high-potential iron-sulfur protein [Halieaceae bacterium]|jgi:hypothetical protein|nr:high-potential iron-sulfur protein [Halieaceae bacterium]